MMPPFQTPPRRRNDQVRTYVRLLRVALRHAAVDDPAAAADVLRELLELARRIRHNTHDPLEDINARALIATAHRLLGLSDESLPVDPIPATQSTESHR